MGADGSTKDLALTKKVGQIPKCPAAQLTCGEAAIGDHSAKRNSFQACALVCQNDISVF